MLTYEFPKTGEQISRLGFGLMRLPGQREGHIDYRAASALVDRAITGGVNYFDTAYVYGDSEDFAGEALSKYPRESFYLATKLPIEKLKKVSDAQHVFNEQLTRCRVDYFDFYLLHSIENGNWDAVKKLGLIRQADGWKKEGRVKHLGFSYHGDYDIFREVLDAYPWEFVQIQINYVDDKLQNARALLDELTLRDIPAFVMEPIRGGYLACLHKVGADMLRSSDASRTPAEWALRWCLCTPNLNVILSGMSTMDQIEENLRIFSEHKPLSTQDFELLDKVHNELQKIEAVPCTGCGYCMKCPSGVDIPGVMGSYNDYKRFGNKYTFLTDYNYLDEHSGKACTNCGECLPKCPQGLNIPGWLSKIGDEVEKIC